jgi:hypothetical protein
LPTIPLKPQIVSWAKVTNKLNRAIIFYNAENGRPSAWVEKLTG